MQAAIEYLASIGFMKTDDLCFRVFEEVDRISMDILDKLVIPIPGATELVNTLSRFECKIAIATTDRSYRATLALKALGLNEKVDLIVGADCVSETKPNPEMIYYILDKLNVEKRHALMVGDAITDVDMGGRAGLSGTIGVLTGQTPKEILKKSTPHIIESVSQIDVIQDDS
jgi:phosphoglycolate phosphatase